MFLKKNLLLSFLILMFLSCENKPSGTVLTNTDSSHNCMPVPARFSHDTSDSLKVMNADDSYAGMVLIPGGEFMMGGDNEQASNDEYPKHAVSVSPFYMDETEVTNAQFKAFVDATGYITIAERKPDWNELKKTLAPGTPEP